jgi:hypothetical protein
MVVKTKQSKKPSINNSALAKFNPESTTPEEIKVSLRMFINHEKKSTTNKNFLPHKYNSVVPTKQDENTSNWPPYTTGLENINPFNPNENNNNNNNNDIIDKE